MLRVLVSVPCCRLMNTVTSMTPGTLTTNSTLLFLAFFNAEGHQLRDVGKEMKDQIISVNSFNLDEDPITFYDKSLQKILTFQQAHVLFLAAVNER